MTPHRLGWLIALAPFAIAHAADEPEWLTKARAAESAPVPTVDIRSPDGELTARVPAKLAGPISRDEDEYLMQFDVGPDVTVDCELLFEGFDSGGLLRQAAKITFDDVSKMIGKVDNTAVEAVDAGAWGPYPYLRANWLYRVAMEGGARVGGLKQVAVDLHEHGLYCAVVDLGYEQTLLAIARSLADTLRLKGAAPTLPKYLDISTTSVGSNRVGWSTNEISVDAEGDLRYASRSTLLVPAAQGGASATDTVQVEWTDPKGAMLNAAQFAVNNGSTEADLKLDPEGDDGWKVSGTFRSKPLATPIAGGPPQSNYAEVRKLRAAMARPDAVGYQASSPVWTSLDPTRFIEMGYRITERLPDGTFRVEETIGPVTATMVLDPATGFPVKTTIPIGPTTMTIERVYHRGTP